MKKVLLLVVLLTGMVLVQGCEEENISIYEAPTPVLGSHHNTNNSQQKKFEGFRGIKWGTNIQDVNVPNMVLIKTSKDTLTTEYIRNESGLSVGAAKVSRLTYSFYKNKFCHAMIGTEGYENFHSLKLAVFAQYGEGYQSNRYIERWYWFENHTDGKVIMMLEYNEIRKIAIFNVFFQPICKQREKDAKNIAANSGGDF